MHPCINATISIIKKLQYNFSKNSSDLVAGSFPNGQLHGKTHVTRLGSLIWQSPSHGKTQRDILGKTHGTIQGSITWQNPLNGKSHWDIHGKNHGTKNCTFRCWVATTSIHFLDSYHDFLGANPY